MRDAVRDPRQPGPLGRALIAAALGVVGLVCLAIGFHWVSAEPSPGVPRWVVGLVGAVFSLAAVAVVLPRDSRIGAVLAALIATGFAAISGWIAFGPGDRAFGMSISFGGFASDGKGSEWLGRVAFGIGALMCGVFALLMGWHALRRRTPSDADSRERSRLGPASGDSR